MGKGKTMLDNKIIETDKFLDLKPISRDLYTHLLLNSDDEGFVANPKNVIRLIGAKVSDLNNLKDEGYIYLFPSGVVLITHYWVNNNHDSHNNRPTIFTDEKSLIYEDNSHVYRFKEQTDSRLEADSKERNKETNTKETNKLTNSVRLVGLPDDSIYNSLSDKDRNSLEAECRKHKVSVQELIKAIDISVKSRKEQTDIKTPYRYIIQIAEAKNWNIDEINKSYHPVNNSPESPLKHYRDIEGSLWGKLDEKQRASMKAQYEGDDLTRLIKDIDTLVKANPGETYRGTEVSLFKKLADRILAEGR